MVAKPAIAPLPAFSKRDCALLAQYPTRRPKFNEIPEQEGNRLRDIRERLERLAAIGAERYAGRVPMTSSVSGLNPNGRVPRSYWSCFFPRLPNQSRTSKSFNFQLTLIILPAGAEILFCLGGAQTQEKDPEALGRNDEHFQAVRQALAKVDADTLRHVEQKLSPAWHFRKRWMLSPPAQDFKDLAAWREHAASAKGAGASISRYFDLDDIKSGEKDLSTLFLEASALFQPLFEEVYAKIETVAPEVEVEVEAEAEAEAKPKSKLKPRAAPKRTPSSEAASPRLASSPVAAEAPPRLDLQAIHADFAAALRASDLVFGRAHDELIRTFLASLAAKRFLILTGLSGSGKTQVALRFGEWLGGDRALVIPVRPDWTGAEALFGYEDALLPIKKGARAWSVPQALELMLRAARDPERPYLLLLDEMNLAHVERYFADFLSGLETQKPCLPNLVRGGDGCFRLAAGEPPRVPLPPNLFVIGTVNVDETTYLFSPKVFDRANTIEVRVHTEDLGAARRRPKPCREGPSDLVRGLLGLSRDEGWHDDNRPPGEAEFTAGLLRIHQILADDHLEFAHRVFHEASRFSALFAASGDADPHRALDRQLMQKILPRMHGSQRRLQGPLAALAYACFDAPPHPAGAEGRRRFDPLGDTRPGELRLPISHEKICRLMRSLRTNQFASFTE